MNKLLKKLENEAKEFAKNQLGEQDKSFNEKFAELIMAECAKACETDHCNTLASPAGCIAEHFGMEYNYE